MALAIIDKLNALAGAINKKAGTTGPMTIDRMIEVINNLELGSDQEYATYEGSYEITPRTVSQTLPTENKLLIQNLNIKSIPYYETSNETGGTTVVIGGA